MFHDLFYTEHFRCLKLDLIPNQALHPSVTLLHDLAPASGWAAAGLSGCEARLLNTSAQGLHSRGGEDTELLGSTSRIYRMRIIIIRKVSAECCSSSKSISENPVKGQLVYPNS